MPASVLIIDDEESIAWALRQACERQGYHSAVAATAEDGLILARKNPPDAVFLDVRLPGMDGLTALGKFKQVAPEAAIVVITAHGNLATAVQAVSGGAFDYLAKPFDLDQALDAIQRAVDRPVRGPGGEESGNAGLAELNELVGRSASMQGVFKRIALVAPTETCVLITGESGTGKELVARAIHSHSSRRDKPFLPVHMAALNPNLVESELFGHAKGAFTGADRAHPGLLTLANGGTVFLDELADTPLPVQAKLLRVLEQQEVLPVGGTDSHRINVRVVSATHADLEGAVAAGRFRRDLFFRLNGYPIHLPRLGDRVSDIPLLAEHFLRLTRATAGPLLLPETLDALRTRSWPGNVRELRNVLEQAVIVARGGPIRPEHLPAPSFFSGESSPSDRIASAIRDWVQERLRSGGEPSDLYQQLLSEVEPALLGEVVRRVEGNRMVAGKWLGLARTTVRKLIIKYGLEESAGQEGEVNAHE